MQIPLHTQMHIHFAQPKFLASTCLVIDGSMFATGVFLCSQVKMLPTPAKFHYIFNLRDLSRIWEGILHVDHETITNKSGIMALWKHECQRVISDRFTNPEDRDWFDKAVTRVAGEDLGEDIAGLIPEEPYFVDFLRDPPEPTGDEPEDQELEAPKIYEPVSRLAEHIRKKMLSEGRLLHWNLNCCCCMNFVVLQEIQPR